MCCQLFNCLANLSFDSELACVEGVDASFAGRGPLKTHPIFDLTAHGSNLLSDFLKSDGWMMGVVAVFSKDYSNFVWILALTWYIPQKLAAFFQPLQIYNLVTLFQILVNLNSCQWSRLLLCSNRYPHFSFLTSCDPWISATDKDELRRCRCSVDTIDLSTNEIEDSVSYIAIRWDCGFYSLFLRTTGCPPCVMIVATAVIATVVPLVASFFESHCAKLVVSSSTVGHTVISNFAINLPMARSQAIETESAHFSQHQQMACRPFLNENSEFFVL